MKFGRPAVHEEVVLHRRISANAEPKVVAKTKTDGRGNFLFRAIKPGRYELNFYLPFEEKQAPKGSCGAPGFTLFSIGVTTDTGKTMVLVSGLGKTFKAKGGDRIVKDIVLSCN